MNDLSALHAGLLYSTEMSGFSSHRATAELAKCLALPVRSILAGDGIDDFMNASSKKGRIPSKPEVKLWADRIEPI